MFRKSSARLLYSLRQYDEKRDTRAMTGAGRAEMPDDPGTANSSGKFTGS